MPDKEDGPQSASNGDGETDPKAPLAKLSDEEEEDIGDPVPANVQAVLSLCGVVGAIMFAMGLTSSEWVIAVEGFYWQGLFIYCAGGEFNSTLIELDDDAELGCKNIDLDEQGYTMGVAVLGGICLSTNIFGVLLALLGSWVRDIDSKRKVYKLSVYMLVICIITNVLGMLIYASCFGDVMEEAESIGPFKDPEDDWEIGWSFEIIATALAFQVITVLSVAYGLLLLPIIEEVEVDEEEK